MLSSDIGEILDLSYLGNPLWRWLLMLAIVAATMIVLRIFRENLARRLRVLATRSDTDADDFVTDLIGKTKPALMFSVAMYAGSLTVELPETANSILTRDWRLSAACSR